MNRTQKIVWLMVIAISIGMVAGCTAFGVLYFKVGMPKALAGFGFVGIAGLGGLGPLIFRKDKGAVAFDERDREIQRKSALAGFALAYLVVGIATMGPFTILGPRAPITTSWLPTIFGAAGITHFYAWSIAILVQYGRRNKNE